MARLLRAVIIVLALSLSVALLPYAGLPYRPISVTALRLGRLAYLPTHTPTRTKVPPTRTSTPTRTATWTATRTRTPTRTLTPVPGATRHVFLPIILRNHHRD